MTIGQADLLKHVNAVWDASTLDATFKALWTATPAGDDFPVLHDAEAGGEQPWPFCVLETMAGSTRERMSRLSTSISEIQDVPVNFRVHATYVAGDVRTAKQITAYLAEEVIKVFGGHPTVAPADVTLDNGGHLVTTKLNDYSIREDKDHYVWVISYSFRLDVPVLTG